MSDDMIWLVVCALAYNVPGSYFMSQVLWAVLREEREAREWHQHASNHET